jgi:hypothetical protein
VTSRTASHWRWTHYDHSPRTDSPWRWRHYDPLKRRQLFTSQHDVTIQKALTFWIWTENRVQWRTFWTQIWNLMCSMSVHHIIQKTLNINKCTKSFFVNYNTLLRVSTLLGHLQGELFCYRYTKVALYSWVRMCCWLCTVYWRREFSAVQACSRLQKQRSTQSTAHSHSTV